MEPGLLKGLPCIEERRKTHGGGTLCVCVLEDLTGAFNNNLLFVLEVRELAKQAARNREV